MTDDEQDVDVTGEIPTQRFPTQRDVRQAQQTALTAVAAEAERLPRQVRRIAQVQASQTARRIGLIGAILAALLSVAVSLVAYSNSTDAQARALATQASVDSALGKLNANNDTLIGRGQAPVPVPVAPTPTDAIAAAVLAQVLAQLPPTPTADQVAGRLQAAVTANVLGPSLDELTGQVARYFATHPPVPGPAPTQEAIQAAVDKAYLANPPKDGTNGVDGMSPACLSEPSQCRGETGDPGPAGPAGADSTVPGPQGVPPNSWSWPDPIVPRVTHACTRSGGTDQAPDYACT